MRALQEHARSLFSCPARFGSPSQPKAAWLRWLPRRAHTRVGGCKQRGVLASDGSDASVTDSPEVFALIPQLRHHFAEPPLSTGGVTPKAYVTSLERDT